MPPVFLLNINHLGTFPSPWATENGAVPLLGAVNSTILNPAVWFAWIVEATVPPDPSVLAEVVPPFATQFQAT